MSTFDVNACRRHFPGLLRRVHGRPAVFFDGPAGSQVPQRVADAVARCLLHTNANHGGVFATSVENDELVADAHRAVADFLNAADASEVAFGANMTTMTFALSRALAKTWKPGDEVIVTRLDHDANITPWVLAARDAGAVVRQVRFHPEDCTLDLDDFRKQLSPRTRLVAVGCASNAVGTVNPVKQITAWAHEAGAQVFLDAVHYAPHLPIDMQDWGCDYLACSAYKFFGPHLGILWGRKELLGPLPTYKLRPAPDDLPGRWMTGTANFEGIAGTWAAIEYLTDLGCPGVPTTVRRSALLAAYGTIIPHERFLARKLIRGLTETPGVKVWGITDPNRLTERVPTVSFTHERHTPLAVAEHLAKRGIFVWHGNFYAPSATEDLGLEPNGMVRVGILHYNTTEEVQRLLAALGELP
jgi:cysteine desulfurase family protein (TIGR01976 family)